jgi:two-component system cell cycle response regulator
MNASLLIVGDDWFLAFIQRSIETLSAITTEAAANPTEAVPLIQAQQPDILMLQAQAEALELCYQIKSQSRLAWIYCVLISNQPQPGQDSHETERKTIAQIDALRNGADAYLEISIDDLDSTSSNASTKQQLVNAYICSGLRRVKNYRELMRTNDLLSAIALSDPLTELNNRRAFEWELPRQIQNARMRNMPISLVMLDVDYFKTINDTYGHLVGDRALQLLSARLRHNLRFYDTPFRYGGEEFVIILSDTGKQESMLIADRICRLISDQAFVVNDELDLIITISAGVASLRPDDDGRGMSLLHRSDQNLLKAKTQGRNRVVGEESCGVV